MARKTRSTRSASKVQGKKKAAKKKSAKKRSSKKKATKKKSAKKTTKKKTATKKPAKQSPKKKAAKKKTVKKKVAKKKLAKKKVAKKKVVRKPAASKKKSAKQRTKSSLSTLLSDLATELKNQSGSKASRLSQSLRRAKVGIEDFKDLLKLFGPGDPHGLRTQVLLKLESLPEAQYIDALLNHLTELKKRSADWAFVAILRILNTRGSKQDASRKFETAVRRISATNRRLLHQILISGAKQLPTETRPELAKALRRLGGDASAIK